jgi:UDP-N-acetylmuramyl pentapeptide synthase
MRLEEIVMALRFFVPPNGRLKLIEGLRGSHILDDTYNASPSSTETALETLSAITAKRRIAALGDMLELGSYSEEAHRQIGVKASSVCDILVVVGARMRFVSDEAVARGFEAGKEFFACDTSQEAGALLAKIVREGDVVLVKGSQSMRMEKAVKDIMAHPENATKLLVRQEESWLNKL